jgi:hypothetical protein
MSDLTPEMIAAGTAAIEEYVGGHYVQLRRAAVRVWMAMSHAKAGEPLEFGDTFELAYRRNLEKAQDLAAVPEHEAEQRLRRTAAAKEHGLPVPEDVESPSAAIEREWQEWLAANG